jgi:hypothetical protein
MPRSHLTPAALKRIKPPSKGEKVQQVDHFDTSYPGLAFRISYGNTRSWVFVYRYQGKQRRKTLGKYPALGLAEAREKWREARAKLDKGEDPAAEAVAAQGSDGFKDVMERWLALDRQTIAPKRRRSASCASISCRCSNSSASARSPHTRSSTSSTASPLAAP